MSDQSRKQRIGLAGEFLVAGELLRRGIMAAVTYGNAKKADVVAVNGSRATSLELSWCGPAASGTPTVCIVRAGRAARRWASQ